MFRSHSLEGDVCESAPAVVPRLRMPSPFWGCSGELAAPFAFDRIGAADSWGRAAAGPLRVIGRGVDQLRTEWPLAWPLRVRDSLVWAQWTSRFAVSLRAPKRLPRAR